MSKLSYSKKIKYGFILLMTGGILYLGLFAVSAYFEIDGICKEPSKFQLTEFMKFEISSDLLVYPFLLAAIGIFFIISEPIADFLSKIKITKTGGGT